jgi:hypothetical protein
MPRPTPTFDASFEKIVNVSNVSPVLVVVPDPPPHAHISARLGKQISGERIFMTVYSLMIRYLSNFHFDIYVKLKFHRELEKEIFISPKNNWMLSLDSWDFWQESLK